MKYLFVIVMLVLVGCSPEQLDVTLDSKSEDDLLGAVTFEFYHSSHDERWRATTIDPDVIDKLRKELKVPYEKRVLFAHGILVRGAGDNAPWSWHIEPSTWKIGDVSTEFCDTYPSYVERNLDEVLEKVGAYCPYASKVDKEL